MRIGTLPEARQSAFDLLIAFHACFELFASEQVRHYWPFTFTGGESLLGVSGRAAFSWAL